MTTIICKQCGYENPVGSMICEMCASELEYTLSDAGAQVIQQATVVGLGKVDEMQSKSIAELQQTSQQTSQQTDVSSGGGYEYYVLCPESQTKTILPGSAVADFYCVGCKRQHEIDGFLWNIERRKAEPVDESACIQVPTSTKGDTLWLEEIVSHVRIEIDKEGGTLGRYGKFGAQFFQERNMLTVSGEHCIITNEFGDWVIRHISNTNDTKYNNMVLGKYEPNLLEDGKMLTLSNAVTFIVRIV